MIRDIGNLFELEKEENYYKSGSVIFIAIITFNTKVMVIKIKYYLWKNILMQLGHT